MNEKYIDIIDSQKTSYKKIFIFITIFLVFIWGLTGINTEGISEGAVVAKNIMLGILHPSLDKIFSLNEESVIYLLTETFMIAFLGTLFGSIIAIIFAFLGANNLTPKWLHKIIRIFLSVIRTIPALVYGIMVIKVTGPGAFAGVVTFMIASIGMVSKLFIEDIEELNNGLKETAQVAGLNWFQTVRLIIFPQILNSVISIYLYRFEINLRDAAILGLIGAGGLGTPLMLAMAEQRWNDVGAYLIGLMILVLIVDNYSTKIRNKLTRG